MSEQTDYPASKTQQQVLSALKIEATGYYDAERKFAELGIAVSGRREGRHFIPVVKIVKDHSGLFDFSPIQKWMAE